MVTSGVNMRIVLSFICLWIFSLPTYADIVAEGWYKVLSANVHVGYYVSRFEYDSKKREFISKSFLKTNAAGGDITESMEAFADEGMNPIKYSYTSIVGGQTTTIDAAVKKNVLVAVKEVSKLDEQPTTKTTKTVSSSSSSSKTKTTIETKLEKGTFFSSHLALLMLKKGLKVGVNFEYKAVAEEDAKVYDGRSLIKEIKKAGEKALFRILNDYKSVKYVSLMDTTGQLVATKAPTLGLITNLQATQKEATGNIPVPLKSLKKIFGKLP